ncbi:MAG: hypothetical protein AMJ79_09375 [Phycisphaerae bacterium SM23_30]|nr:MAG: hypothetical protein AMJ79_09375 [Phycisphaerae bacterium SM23_30]
MKKKVEFDRVYAVACRAADPHLVLYARTNRLGPARMGLSVGKKMGPAAKRNRYKRTLREAFRLTQHELPAGLDYVLIPRPKAIPSTKLFSGSLRRLAPKVARRCKLKPIGDESEI